MRLYGFELPNAFSTALRHLTSPPRVGSVEARPVQTVVAAPRAGFYNPDDLKFPEAMKPVVPGCGGYITQGMGMVEYDHQAMWDRNAPIAGPVREFFHGVMFDNRVKHT